MPDEKYKLIKVVSVAYYYVPMIDEKKSKINGWTLTELIKDWFKRYRLDAYHATRNQYKIGGTEKVLSADVASEIED